MKKSLKIFIACFLGIICGGLVLSKITGQFSFLRLLIGMLVGGPMGYLAYDFKTVIKIVPKAWNAVKGWKPNKEWWRELGAVTLGLSLAMTTVTIGILTLLGLCLVPSGDISLTAYLKASAFAGLGVIIFMVIFMAPMSMASSETDRKNILSHLMKFNPIRVYFRLLPKYTILGLLYALKKTPYAIACTAKFFWKSIVTIALFIKTLIIMIHSDERLVCMFDAMLGLVIFYFWGNLILSAICGGLLAVLNWQIISVRILHLNPSKIKNT